MPKKRISKKASSLQKGRRKSKAKKRIKNLRHTYFNYLIILLILAISIIPILWMDKEVAITGLVIFQTNSQSDFDEGIYNNTFYDSAGSFVQLNLHNQSGLYTSKVFDAGGLSSWNNLTWTEVLSSEEKIFVVDANADVWIGNNSGDWTLLKDDYTGAGGNGATYMVLNSTNGFFIIFNQDIWSSTDFGYTWIKINDDYNGGEGNDAIVAIVDNSNNLYIIEGDEDVWKSADSGSTWSKTATNFNGGSGNMEGLVENSSNILIAVDVAADIWFSDNGDNWTLLKDDYNGAEGNNPNYMIIDNNDNLFIMEGDNDVWKSTDSGSTWEKVNDDYSGEAQEVKVAIADSSNNLYIIEGDEDVWKSTDSGSTWSKTATNFNSGNDNVKGIAITNVTTNLKFQVSSDDDNLSWSGFTGPDGTSNTYYTDSTEILNVTNNQYFQYQAYFTSDDGISSPRLSDVNIGYELADATPPESVTNLNESLISTDWIYWNWTIPADSDFDHTEVWLDGVFKVNTSNSFYNATGLNSNTTYEIQTRTSDTSENINASWVNDTATTDEGDTTFPKVFALIPTADTIFYVADIIEISANITDDASISSVMANITYPNETIDQLILSLAIDNKYNNSFTVPDLTGIYNITFIVNDTNNNINNTEKTNFTVQNVPSGSGSGSGGGSGRGGGRASSFTGPASPTSQAPQTSQTSPVPKSGEKVITPTKALFDITSDLTKSEIISGERLSTKISLVNFGVPGKVKVALEYAITDLENNAVLTELENIEVETQTEFIKIFELPSDIQAGEYKLSAKLTYEDQEAVSQNSFQIIPKIKKEKLFVSLIRSSQNWIIVGGMAIMALAIILLRARLKKH